MKKWLSVFIIVAFCLSLGLTGCQPETTTTQPGTTTTRATTTAPSGIQTSAPGDLPIVIGDPVTLRVFYVPSAFVTDMETNYATTWFQEKTNVEIDWMLASPADSAERLSLLLAANDRRDMPDVFLAGMSRPVAEAYGNQGVLLDLTELIETYGVNMKQLFDHNDRLEAQMTAFDGNKYYLFRYWETVHVRHTQRMWMNMRWLENVGMDVPTTTDDFYQVLRAFKEQDANDNGDPDDEIPFIHFINYWINEVGRGVMNAFVYDPVPDNKLYHENGQVKVSFAEEGWREGLRFYKTLYDEQLLDNECFSMTIDQAKALGAAEGGNRVGCLVGGIVSIYDFADPTIHEFEVIPPLQGPTGLRQAPLEFFNPTPYYAMSSYCEFPEIAYRWADAMLYNSVDDIKNGDFTWLNFWYGPEDDEKGWSQAAPGEVGFTDEPAAYRWNFSWGETLNTHWYEGFLIMMQEEWKPLMAADMGAGYQQEKILYDATVEKMMPYAVDKTLPVMSFDEATAIEVSELQTDLIIYWKEMQAKFIRGEASLDTDWDAYLQELRNIGLERFLEIHQEALDAFLAN